MTLGVTGVLGLAGASSGWALCQGGAPDGVIAPGESCDDGNITAMDGCSPTCQVEPGWSCSPPQTYAPITIETHDNGCSLQLPQWTLDADQLGALQTADPYPTVALFGAQAKGPQPAVLELELLGPLDDDYVGLVIGFEPGDMTNPNADFLLLDWRRAANRMVLSRVRGVTGAMGCRTSDLPSWELWNKTGAVTPLATATALPGRLAWVYNQPYRFQIEYSDTTLRVLVNGVEHFNLTTPAQLPWPDGQLGFYNMSQPNVRYRVIAPFGPSACVRSSTQDLAITQLETSALVFDRQTLALSGQVQLQLQNLGALPVTSPFSTVLFLDRDQDGALSPADTTLGNAMLPGLAAGATTTATVTVSGVTADFAGQPVLAWVDPQDAIIEDDETNNLVSSARLSCAGQPDLTVAQLRYDLSSYPAQATLQARVGNAGDATIPASAKVAFYDGDPALGGALIGESTLMQALAPGAWAQVQRVWSAPGPLNPESRRLFVVADPQDQLHECVELNTHSLIFPLGVQIDEPASGASINVAQPALRGSGRAGARVTLSLKDAQGATLLSTSAILINAQGQWAIQPPAPLSDGVYTVQAVAQDEIGNQSIAITSTFTLDTMAPPLLISSPLMQAQLNSATPQVAGTSSPGALITLEVRDAMGELAWTQTLMADAMGAWGAMIGAALQDGEYTLTARTTSAAGNSATTTRSFSVDTTPPQIAISSPAPNSTLNVSEILITGNTDPGSRVTLTVRDAQGGVVLTAMALANAIGDWSLTTSPLSRGVYQLEAKSVDAANNEGMDTIQITVDTQLPTLSVSSPLQDQCVMDASALTLRGQSDPDAVILLDVEDERRIIVLQQTLQVDAQGRFEATLTQALAEGVYKVRLTALRPNDTRFGQEVLVRVDSTPPELELDSPDPDAASSTPQLQVSGRAEPDAQITISLRELEHTTRADANGVFAHRFGQDGSPLEDGPYTLSVSAQDDCGNVTQRVLQGQISAMALQLSVTSPTPNMIYTNPRPLYEGLASPGLKLRVFVDGRIVRQLQVDASGMWTAQGDAPLEAGGHTLRVEAEDASGRTLDSPTIRFIVELPVLERLAITTPATGDVLTVDSLDVRGIGAPGQLVELWVDEQLRGTTTVGANARWTIPLRTLAPGRRVLEARLGELSVQVTITILAPLPEQTTRTLSGGAGCAQSASWPAQGAPWAWGLALMFALRRRRSPDQGRG